MLIRSDFEAENAVVAIVVMRTIPAIVKTKLVFIIALSSLPIPDLPQAAISHRCMKVILEISYCWGQFTLMVF